MMVGTEAQARNRRLGLLLFGVFTMLCLGSVAYINWFHTDLPKRMEAETR